ncbi:hypothetical protein LCGC14_2811880 [marine sediment metagenome]|uniref:Uncharacterized protein n=1 Tax=marine sediment metagenome TaxID=412755 RepID=A0A0F8YJL0_9ZZZZ
MEKKQRIVRIEGLSAVGFSWAKRVVCAVHPSDSYWLVSTLLKNGYECTWKWKMADVETHLKNSGCTEIKRIYRMGL